MNRIRKYFGMAAIFASAMVLAAEEAPLIGSYYSPGNTVFGLAGAYELNRDSSYKSLGIYPSAEVLLWKPDIAGYAPFDFGVAAEGRLGLPLERGAGLSAGAAAEGSLHVGFRGFDFPYAEYLDRLELYARFGISFDFLHREGFQVGSVATSGANYFLDERLMLGLSYTGWGSGDYGVDGVSVQVRYRLGKTPRVRGMGDAWKRYEEAVEAMEALGPVTQFYAFFFYSVYTGGYYWNGDTFAEGSGTIWHYYESDDDSFYLERLLLESTDEGEWWSLRYFNEEGDEYAYEYLLTPEKELAELLYRDEEGVIQSYEFTDESELTYLNEEDVVSYEDMTELASKKEDVTVPAGTFKDCARLSDSEDGTDYDWWFSDSVEIPGRMVKFRSEDGSTVVTGELAEILTGKTGMFRLK